MDSADDVIEMKINYSKENFILNIAIVENKLSIVITIEDSIERFERQISYKELIDFRAFSLFDNLEEIFTALKENFKCKEKITLEYNSDRDLDLNFEINYLTKNFRVKLTIVKREQDTSYLLEYILDDLKKIKKENQELRKENQELRKTIKEIVLISKIH